MAPKRKALEPLSANTTKRTKIEDHLTSTKPASSKAATTTTTTKTPKVNKGGGSQLQWFNKLLRDEELAKARRNLIGKLDGRKSVGDLGCLEMPGKDGNWRPVTDKAFMEVARKRVGEELPERFMPYHVALLAAKREIPVVAAPPLPDKLRKVMERSGKELNKAATWVCSHLCHNKLCSNEKHVVWEPSWMNRLRDNCAGGELCNHLPDKCLRAHRNKEVIDWTDYLVEEAVEEEEDEEL